MLGCSLGKLDGHVDGRDDGLLLGCLLGCIDGNDVGCLDGLETSKASDEGMVKQQIGCKVLEQSHVTESVRCIIE